ncbi:MAG: hypothetical protein HRT95_00480 [Moritella sp.]|uniref:hypothetical protein n=1 Tax=Moritella sp. TaxID=78556 RepID=UPI001D32ACA4|nr:hypothetical protein [Moritella sp.]NQZ48693.1 hypothetical protein [Moritella sp.]
MIMTSEMSIPRLTLKGIDMLQSFTLKHRNSAVAELVNEALLNGVDEDGLNKHDWMIRRDVKASLETYHNKIRVLSQLKSRLPQKVGDDEYVKLVAKLFQRTPSETVVNQLVQLKSHGIRQIDVVNEHGLETSNINRLVKRYINIEILAKKTIVEIFILPS